jgi:hypothetical protein
MPRRQRWCAAPEAEQWSHEDRRNERTIATAGGSGRKWQGKRRPKNTQEELVRHLQRVRGNSLHRHKYKLSHRRADKGTWSASESAQRRHLLKILKSMIAELEKESKAPARATKDKPAGRVTAKAAGRAKRKALAAARKRASGARQLAAA